MVSWRVVVVLLVLTIAQALRAAEQKQFKVSQNGRSNIVNSLSFSGLVGSDTKSLTVTTIPEGESFEVLSKSYDISVKSILLDRYILVAIELFDGEGRYEHRDIGVHFCLSSRDERLNLGVYRLPLDSTNWEEVTNIQQVSKHCFVATTPLCVLAIGVSGEDLYAPRYQQPFSASTLYNQFLVSECSLLYFFCFFVFMSLCVFFAFLFWPTRSSSADGSSAAEIAFLTERAID